MKWNLLVQSLKKNIFQEGMADPKCATTPLTVWVQTARDQSFQTKYVLHILVPDLWLSALRRSRVWQNFKGFANPLEKCYFT